MVKQMLSTQKDTINTPPEKLSHHDAQLENEIMIPSQKRYFFSGIGAIYWFVGIFVLLSVAGASVYYVSKGTFVSQVSMKRTLPQLQHAGNQMLSRITVLMQRIKSIPLKLDRSQFKKSATHITQNVEKPIVAKFVRPKVETTHRDKIMDLEKNLDTIQHQVNDFSSQMHKIDNQLSDIVRHLQELEAKLKNKSAEHSVRHHGVQAVAQSTGNALSPQNVQKSPTISIESIHAIIPGRAWLNSQDGQMMSVGLGSYVPDYGVVRLIEPNRGWIQFSSGKVIYLNTKEY